MNNNRDNSEYQVPAFGKRKAYNFVSNVSSLDIYNELSQIAEEIEECRLRNC